MAKLKQCNLIYPKFAYEQYGSQISARLQIAEKIKFGVPQFKLEKLIFCCAEETISTLF